MLREYQIFGAVPINFLKFPGNAGRGLKLDDQLFLSNDASNIRQLFTQQLQEHTGKADIGGFLAKGATFAYKTGKIRLESLEHEIVTEQLDKLLHQVLEFVHALWLIRDTPAHPDCAIMEIGDKGYSKLGKMYQGRHYSLASGDSKTATEFTLEELRSVRDIKLGAVKAWSTSPQKEGAESFKPPKTLPNAPEISRVQRSLHTINSARSSILMSTDFYLIR